MDLEEKLGPKKRARPDCVKTQERVFNALMLLGAEGFALKYNSELLGRGESTLKEGLDKFCKAMVEHYYEDQIKFYADADDLQDATNWYVSPTTTISFTQ